MCYVILLPFSYYLQDISQVMFGITGGRNQLGDTKKMNIVPIRVAPLNSAKAHIPPETFSRREKVDNQHEIDMPNANSMQPFSTVLFCSCYLSKR